MAKAIIFNGYIFANVHESTEQSIKIENLLKKEERSLEGGGVGGGSIGGSSFGGTDFGGGGRGMINVTPSGGSGGRWIWW